VLSRSLLGAVTRKGTQQPLVKAVVYLKNTKTLEVRTFITRGDGRYRFDSLSPNTDYDVFVIYNGKRTDTKTLSAFDSRPEASIDFKIDLPPAAGPSPAPPR
jgi:Tol biopolymer transport system component